MYKTEFLHNNRRERLILISDTYEEAVRARPAFPFYNLVKIKEVKWEKPTPFEYEQLRGFQCR